jgi:Transposase DDE domain
MKIMKNHLMELKDKIVLRKRAIIETVNDELQNHCQLEHARHRSNNGFLQIFISTLVA